MNVKSAILALLLAPTLGVPAHAEGGEVRPDWMRFLDNDYYKVHLALRPRMELADREGLDFSHAWTVRTAVALESKPFHGLSALVEGEGAFALSTDTYFDVVGPPNGKTPIADPQFIELNRAWVRYRNDGLLGLDAKAGRQRIVYDDARFIGNVGWRQNEQTYDAAQVASTFGVANLEAEYAYLWDVHRIFGDRGGAAQADFDSSSHLIRVSYKGFEPATLTAFAYLLDFDDSPVNSSNSVGFRVDGSHALNDRFSAGYILSYAVQTDGGNNPLSYTAHYVNAEGALGMSGVGRLGVGYELLGSDDGKARFVTPLATAHKFNGFADVFLNNGGPNGLQDFYVYYAPPLPWGMKGKAIYHHFRSDYRNDGLGDEIDFVVTKKLTRNLTALSKGAWFGADSPGLDDIWRFWLQLEFKL